MTPKKETGGSAFPMIGNIAYKSDWQTEEGMTLRDWFAGMALQGLLVNYMPEMWTKHSVQSVAYSISDEMLKERSK